MTDTTKQFKKSDSLLALRHRSPDLATLHQRIRLLAERLPVQPDDYRSRVVKQACDDLLATDPGAETCFKLKEFVIDELQRVSDDDLPRYLFYRYRYDMYPVQKKLDDFPPCVQIEPTSICNFRCVFCYQTDTEFSNSKSSHMGTMSLDLFKKIVDQLEGECEAITLASRGEPLVAGTIESMLDYAAGKFLGLKVNTNASLLTESKAHAILKAGVNTLVFSADAAQEPLYSQLRVNGNLGKVLANIDRFHNIRCSHYPDSRIITRVSGVRYSEEQNLDDMESFWGSLVDQVAFVDYNPWENTYQQPINEIVEPCSDLWRRMFVWWDGTTNPCDVDYKSTLQVGNASRQTIRDLWMSEGYQALRENHLNGRRHCATPCNRCTVV